MSKTAPRLGRGLSALIAPRGLRETPPADNEPAPGGEAGQIPIEHIRPSRYQPRQSFDPVGLAELAESIRNAGVLQPVLVRQLGGDEYELVAGERRLRAAKLAGLERVPAIVRDVTDAESLELGLIENLQREDLNALERAQAYRQYMDTFAVTAEELGKRIGQSRANVTNYLRLLNLHDDIRRMISAGELGMGQARAVAGIEDTARQLAIARLAVRRNLAVRQVESLARGDTVPNTRSTRGAQPEERHREDVEGALSRGIGLKVKLVPGKKNRGRVVIYYRTLEEFDRIAERLGAGAALE